MSNKGFALSLDGTDADRTPLSRYQAFMLIAGVVVVLLVTATIFVSVSAARPNVSPELAVGSMADAARWNAIGERYSVKAFDVEGSAAANIARWNAMGKHYLAVEALDAERSAEASTARWNAMAEYYSAQAFDAERSAEANTARWNAMAEWYIR